jgi:hypothetical protein
MIYIVVVALYNCKLIFYDKVFNTFSYDAKSVECKVLINKIVDNSFYTIITIICLALVVTKSYQFATTTPTITTTHTIPHTTRITTTITTATTTPTITSNTHIIKKLVRRN